MPKPWMLLWVLPALAGCGGQPRAVKAEVTLNADSGVLTIACTRSSSGACHAAVVGATLARAEAKVGASATIEGVMPGARLCVSDVAPEPGKCDLKEIAPGTTIIRHEKVGRD